MNPNVQGQRLQDRSFRGQNLAGVSFRGADIRGADFREAHLAGADFSQTRAGLSQRSFFVFAVGTLFLSLIVGIIIGSTAGVPVFVITALQEGVAFGWQIITATIALLTLISLLALLLRSGIGSAATGVAIFAGVVVLAVAIPVTPASVAGTGLILLAGFSGLLAGVVLLAIHQTALRSIAKRGWLIPLLLVSGMASLFALWETTIGIGQSPVFSRLTVIQMSAAGLAAATPFAFGIYLSQRAMAGDARFRLIYSVVIALLSRLGTSFRGADLTDASFAEADMAHADLRAAVLVRTDWLGACHLDRARVDDTYLANPALRRLAIAKEGVGQVFDHMNLEGLNLRNANLTNASFVGSTLNQAALQGANLAGARLVHAQLYDTDMSGTCLTGAFIEHWGISTKTRFDGVRCDFVYMHLPTQADPDPMRKPDDNQEFFAPDDFTDFITPIIRTLEYYHQQNTDPREMARTAKTLDLIQRDAINPAISALAVQQLAQRHPEAALEIVSLKAKDRDKLQIRALVSDDAQRATMSEEFHRIYRAMTALPQVDLERLLSNVVYKDERIRQLEAMVMAAISNESFYAETHIKPDVIVKCLLFAASPLEEAPLQLDVEFREITATLRAAQYRDVFQLIPILAARPDDMLQALNQHKPKIVQFSGHGNAAGELMFLDDYGYAKPITTTALTTLFTALKDEIRLVILNACYSEVQASAITQVIDCVIGMDDSISDSAATLFIASFYRALGFGRSIQNAYDQGIASLGLDGSIEQHVPKLLARPGVDAAQILFIAPDPLPR